MAAAATGVQVGAAMVATRFVVQEIGPASLAFLRYAIAVLCLVPPLLMSARVRFAVRDLLVVMGLGIVQFGILIALLNLGLRFIPPTRAALLFSTFPLMTMIIAAVSGRENLSGTKVAGVVLTIIGVGVALGEGLAVQSATGEWLGVLLVLSAALCGALCSVLYRPYLARYPTLPVGAWAMLASVVFLAGPAGVEGLFTQELRLASSAWGAVLFIGVSSGVGYVLWLWALKHTTPTRVTVFLSLSPITAALLGVWLLGEPLTPGVLLGLAGVAAGLWLATRHQRSPR
ncbi:putative permease, DMT superfamily [Microvirga lotononidis]|uniref:Putative permease, DMT superfamily n=2 Tax=Microvirga lotononidis TaxID=864069 RepID=I4YZX5_9HYPH|nr:putative permease, DMT superfamily [Microvirga lotononidis]